MHCVTVFTRCSTQYSFQLRALWCILIKNRCIRCVCVIYLVQKLHDLLLVTSESKGRFLFTKRIECELSYLLLLVFHHPLTLSLLA